MIHFIPDSTLSASLMTHPHGAFGLIENIEYPLSRKTTWHRETLIGKPLLFSSVFYCMMICTDSHDSSA